MFILASAEACGDIALANILSLTQIAFNVICIGVPIILIVSLVWTLLKVVADPDQKHFIRKIISQIVSAVIIFFLPAIVNLIMAWVPDGSGGFNVSSCWQKARENRIETGMVISVKDLN